MKTMTKCGTHGCRVKATAGQTFCGPCATRRAAEAAAFAASRQPAREIVLPRDTTELPCRPGCDCDRCAFVGGFDRE